MRIDSKGLDFIKSFEGFRSNKYVCPGGYATIGYGHLVRADNPLNEISQQEAEELLIQDVTLAEAAIVRLIYIPLNHGQHTALTSFVFNLGAGTLQRSCLRRLINRGDHDDVRSELMRWVWAGGRKLSGLVRRRQAEGRLYDSQ